MQALLGSGVHPERRASPAVNDPPSGCVKSSLSSAGTLRASGAHISAFSLSSHSVTHALST